MSWGAPAFLWASLLAGAVVFLYILKVRRRRVDVPYLRLWESLVVETRARSLFKRLKRWLSLLLQLAILAAMVLGLAQPSFVLGSVKAESIVLLLDVSASMRTIEGEQDRFELLVERARRLIDERSHEDELMLVAVSDRVEVLSTFSRNTIALREALEGLERTHRSLDAARAQAFAEEATRDKENPVVLWLSDGDAGSVLELAANDGRTWISPIGGAADNVGVSRFRARKNTSEGTDYVLALVRNFSDEVREVDLVLSVDGDVRRVQPIALAPGEEHREEYQLSLPLGATLRFDVEGGDAFAADDTAFAIVRPDRLRRVVLVTALPEEAQPFSIAFQSMIEVIDESSMALTAQEYDTLLTDEERIADVTICLNALPANLPARGNLILMNTALPDGFPGALSGVDESPVVWDWDREHLLNRFLNYRDLDLPPARVVEARRTDVQLLVEGLTGPLVLAHETTERRTVYVAFDMTSGLFPFRLAFPVLLRNAIAWFEIEEDVLFEDDYAPGSTISPLRRVPGPVEASWFVGDELRTERVALTNGTFWFDRTDEPGPFRFRVAGRDYGCTVNLFDVEESDVALSPVPEELLADGAIDASRHWLNRELWTYLGLFALVLWAAEWALFHRRITE